MSFQGVFSPLTKFFTSFQGVTTPLTPKTINLDLYYFLGRENMGKCPECGADDWDDGELVITTSMLLGAKTSYMLNFESYDNKNKKRKKVKAKQCKNCDHINLYASSKAN